MKNHKLIVFGFGISLLITACRKNDMLQEKTATVPTETAAVSNWKSLSQWSKQTEENYVVYTSKIEDKTITSSVAEDGMVLAYKKNGNLVIALPSDEKNADNSYFWYYQVAEGSIVFNVEAHGDKDLQHAAHSFTYYVISADGMKDLEQKGFSKEELMKLTYENAKAILKQ